MTVKPMGFRSLLSEPRQIVIPLFQRTYCWSDAQIQGWWNDVMSPTTSLGYHITGKVIFKERDGLLVCIDGQQRSTTTSLLLATLRDAALELVRGGDAASSSIVDELDAVLFKDPRRVYAWAADQARGGEQRIHDGNGQPFGTPSLVPSFEDRVPFFRAITEGILKEAYRKAGRTPEADAGEGNTEPASVQSRAKAIFERQLRDALRRTGAAPGAFLAQLARTALDVMGITFCEILNDVDLPQVFLWFQEKSLFSMGALLHNPAPGLPFRAADLLRNLVLAPSMRLPLEEQEMLYRQLWLEPFERANGGSTKLDPIFDAFLAEKADLHRASRHVSGLEQFVTSFLNSAVGASVAQKTDLSGAVRYARLLSFAEAAELRAGSPAAKGTPVALSQETCDWLIGALVDFADKWRKGIPPVPPVPAFCNARDKLRRIQVPETCSE